VHTTTSITINKKNAGLSGGLAFIDQVTWCESTNGWLPYWCNLMQPPHKEVDQQQATWIR